VPNTETCKMTAAISSQCHQNTQTEQQKPK